MTTIITLLCGIIITLLGTSVALSIVYLVVVMCTPSDYKMVKELYKNDDAALKPIKISMRGDFIVMCILVVITICLILLLRLASNYV